MSTGEGMAQMSIHLGHMSVKAFGREMLNNNQLRRLSLAVFAPNASWAVTVAATIDRSLSHAFAPNSVRKL